MAIELMEKQAAKEKEVKEYMEKACAEAARKATE
jgi:hypothetical protein